MRNRIVWPLIALALSHCGKNLKQVFFHPDVETRLHDSINGGLPIPTSTITPSTTSFNFAAFSDIQMPSSEKTMFDHFVPDVADKNISFFFVAGDLTEDGTPAEMTHVKEVLDTAGIPYFVTLGNHDLFQAPDQGGWGAYKSTFGPGTYSVQIGSEVRLVFLDTGSGEIGSSQFKWLEDQLSVFVKYTIVSTHYPIYEGQAPWIFRLESYQERYRLTALLNKYNVYAFVAGHLHGYEYAKVGNVEHFIVGSMYPFALDLGNHGYLLFSYNNGSMSFRWVDFASDTLTARRRSFSDRLDFAFVGIVEFLRRLFGMG